MKRMSARERKLALTAVTLLVLAVLVQGIAKPLRERLASVNSDLAQRRQAIERGQRDARELKRLDDEVKRLGTRREKLVLKGAVIPEMMRRVDLSAKAAGVKQVDIRPAGQEVVRGHLRTKMQLEMKSSFPTVKNFLYYLESGPNPLVIDRVEISTDKGGLDTVRSTVLVSAYGALQGGK
jgi:hypothetical protein